MSVPIDPATDPLAGRRVRSAVGGRLLLKRALLATLAAGLAGCGGYQPIDTHRELGLDLEERLGPGREVAIPFEIDDPIRELALVRVNPTGSEERRTSAILDFVFADLALTYELVPTRTAIDTFEARTGN